MQVQDSAVVAIQSYYRDATPVVRLYYVNTLTNPEKVRAEAAADSLRVLMKSGELKVLANPFRFINEGTVIDR
ncbi:MAG TPA: hypothetical protein PLJ52_14590 [Tenuifilaceae bacterium]|nr:hypothetical protein [Tenuifilaceae bacterium]